MVLMSLGYLKNFYNIRIVPAVGYPGYELSAYNNNIVYPTYHLLKQDNILLGLDSMDNYKADGDKLPWGHPSKRVHDMYAEYLFKELTSVQV